MVALTITFQVAFARIKFKHFFFVKKYGGTNNYLSGDFC